MPSRTRGPAGGRRRRAHVHSSWQRSPQRVELLALYTEADALLAGWTCRCTAPAPSGAAPETPCCQFAVTGREPYPTAVELEEVRYAVRALGGAVESRRRLPVAHDDGLRVCPLLSDAGRCRIYASRPLGCRTFFCHGAEAPFGARSKRAREESNALGRRVADLSARFAPRDPRPRALSKSLGEG